MNIIQSIIRMKYYLAVTVFLVPLIGYGIQVIGGQDFLSNGLNSGKDAARCASCSFLLQTIITQRRLGSSNEAIQNQLTFFCNFLNLESTRVCQNVIKLHTKIFLYMIDNDSSLSGSDVCGVVLQKNNCAPPDRRQWHVNIPPRDNKTSGTSGEEATEKSSESDFKVLHITDVHYDPDYQAGGNADCGEPLCCQKDQKPASKTRNQCGYWTDYRDADVPDYMIENALEEVNKHEFDYVYFTGDIVTHRSWDTSIEKNTRDIVYFLDQLKKNFKKPVYPILGNHEAHPVSVWPPLDVPDDLSMQWLFDLVAEEWSTWLPEETKDTIKRGGFYTVTPKPGFRIVVLNSNVCYTNNWWLIFNDEDPYGQLQWLTEVLAQAERDSERVHILSHVPVGDPDCFKSWSREYGRIIQRFSDTVAAQFNGHSHFDEFEVFYNASQQTEAIGVAFNGASLTPNEVVNPSFKIFDINGKTLQPIDYEEWTFNLTEANLSQETPPNWYKLYRFTEAYETKDITPKEMQELVVKMAKYHSLVQKYYSYKYRTAGPSVNKPCNSNCEKEQLCSMVTTEYGQRTQCDLLRTIYPFGI